MQEENIDPGHRAVRNILRVVGPIFALIGLIFTIVGFVGFFSAFGSSEEPKCVWCPFVGMPLLFVGLVLSSMGYMGKVFRYQAGEIAPVGKDTFNYMADGTKDGIKTVAKAIGEGLGGALGGAAAAGPPQTRVRCHKCNSLVEEDSKFCGNCGAAVAKTRPCPQCRELNDPDAKFCDNCGHKFA